VVRKGLGISGRCVLRPSVGVTSGLFGCIWKTLVVCITVVLLDAMDTGLGLRVRRRG